MRYAKSSEPEKRPGQFNSQQELINFVLSNAKPRDKFHYTNPDGSTEWFSLRVACEALNAVGKFLSSPERIDCLPLNDGRMMVAQHNWASLTQNLRWSAGLDHESNSRNWPSSQPRTITWPFAALMWFWSNGGPPLPGESGSYHDWIKGRDIGDRKARESVRNLTMKEIPEEVPF